ncbi:undecaprenyl-phosphate glucose phosphotransferase [Photobacterium leiognathi subsp. mandapamensis]|uniref:undecaprenyl-phosphate glucose phosphotransferase n=1 Tax=Photobacterium leiognathi TaxID=553611 RepID=UPI003AF3C61D
MKRKALEIADDGYSFIVKFFDFLVINFSLTLVFALFEFEPSPFDLLYGIFVSVTFIACGHYVGFYDKVNRANFKRMSLRLLANYLLVEIAVLSISTFFAFIDHVQLHGFTNSFGLSWFVLSFLIIWVSRIIVFYTTKYIGRRRKIRKIAILGMTTAGLAIEKALLEQYKNTNFEINYYDDRGEERFSYLTKSKFSGKVSDLIDVAKQGEVDDVYVALPMVAKERIRLFLHQLSDTTVDTYIVPDLYTYNLNVSQIYRVGNVDTFSVFASPFEGIGDFIKRVEDVVIGSIITLLISPVLIAVAIGVKMSSPGPILFKQDRYGLGGRKIKVWKFRSMKVMENSDVVKQATKNDPRVTKFGAFIRRTSLDELPQFINVLQGTMSIVGPRPHAVAHNEEYRILVDNYMIRHKIKPGITGLAQISGYRGETDTLDKMEKRIQYDIRYMQNWSLFLDLKIIFLTIFKGFVSETAY